MRTPTGEGEPGNPHRLTGADFAGELRTGLGRLFREHTTLAITLTYLFLTVIGAVYEFSVLMRFRVNVLQYADPVDFLLAAIRQPLTAVFAVFPLLILFIIDLFDRSMRRFVPAYSRFSDWSERNSGLRGSRAKDFYRLTYAMLIVVYFAAATLNFANYVAKRLRQGGGRPVRVALHTRGVRDTTLVRGILLGTTSRFVFVYEPADSTTHVIPLESIADLILDPRRGDMGSRAPRPSVPVRRTAARPDSAAATQP